MTGKSQYSRRTDKNGIKAFEELAEKGYIDSIHQLGYCYQHGIGTDKSEIKAFVSYNDLAE
ncbi:hypothetical protein C1645_816278 [Glomus cerebriforme]|uniref:Uncharacterized protein n=1 Tax=Glomus cerebriforme TaxID=658196 RepID=A0A397TBR4_9GLOM|nr:hypothetical protein C1645_816278 [Glomus cerebriforme]